MSETQLDLALEYARKIDATVETDQNKKFPLTRLVLNNAETELSNMRAEIRDLLEVARGVVEISKPDHGKDAPFMALLEKAEAALKQHKENQ